MDAGRSAEAAVPAEVLTQKSAIAMVGGVISQALKLLVFIFLARKFSTSQFGLIAFAIAMNAFMFVVSNFGLPIFGTREVAKNGRVPRHLLATVACTRACLALLATGVGVAVLAFVPGVTPEEYLLVAFFGLSNVAVAALFDWVFQGLAAC